MAERTTPIFVVGFGRSGTTLLQSLLGAHPRIAAPPETHFFRRIADHAAYWGDLHDDAALRRVIESALAQPLLRNSGFDVDQVFARARAGPRTLAGVLDAILRDFMERDGKVRWSEKTPGQNVAAIWEHFPDAQVVHIVRDPRESVPSSIAKLGAYQDVIGASYGWRAFTRTALRDGPKRAPTHYLRVRYEDLVDDPLAVMTEVFEFLGEDFDPAVVTDAERRTVAGASADASDLADRVRRPIAAGVTESSRGVLSWRARHLIDGVVAGQMRPLGYPPPPLRDRLIGHVLNVYALPVLAVRAARRRRQSQGSPAKRYDAFARTERVRAERFAARRRAQRDR